MKVLHIALTDSGGAGMGMMNQHLALLDSGIDSKVLVAKKTTSLDSVVEVKPNRSVWSSNNYIYLLEKVARRLGICLTEYDKIHHRIYKIRCKHPVLFSSPVTQYDISDHPLVKEADVINLHFISGFVDVKSFFSKVKKPVVWTIRDENPGLGGFHYEESIRKADPSFADLEREFLEIKRSAIGNCKNLYLVSLSKLVQDFCQRVDFLACHPNIIIHNAINPKDYQSMDTSEAKSKMGLLKDEINISFVSTSLGEKRKRLAAVLKAVGILSRKYMNLQTRKHVRLFCVGQKDFQNEQDGVIWMGSVSDKKLMSLIYSASDVFVQASEQESFGKTVVEALYCGTPVVSTPVGISPEIINEQNGVICEEPTAENLVKAIENVLARKYDRQAIRESVARIFSPEMVAGQYKKLYESILKS